MLEQTINQSSKKDNPAWHVLIASSLGGYFDGLDASIYGLVLYPAMSDLLKTPSHSVVGLYGSFVLAAFLVGWACGAIIFGIVSDYIGRVRTMMITILLYAICTGLCAASHTWQELAFYRFLVGCGIGGEIGAGIILISEYFKGVTRLHCTSIMSTIILAGYLTTSLLNLVIGNLGWRYLFLVGVVPAFLTLYIRAKLKEPSLFGQISPQRQSFSFFEIFLKENKRKTLVVMSMAISAIVTWWAVLAWIPPWINQLTGTQAIQERSYAGIAMHLGALICAGLTGTIVNYLGRANAMRLGFLGSLITCMGMFLLVKSYNFSLLCWIFLAGSFAVLPFVTLFIYVPELFETRIRGTAFGFSVQVGRLFAAAAALLGGQIISLLGGSYALASAAISSINIFGFIASFFMLKTNGEVMLEPAMPDPLKDSSQDLVPMR